MFCPRNIFIPTSVVLLMFCFLGETFASKNPFYDACKEVVSCGDVTVNASYPFWITHEFCGRDGFQIICDTGNPFFDLPFGRYLVKNFNLWKESLVAAGHVNDTCLSDFKYRSSSAMPNMIPVDKLGMKLFYKCNSSFQDNVASLLTCGDNGSSRSYIVFTEDEHMKHNESSDEYCESVLLFSSHGSGSNNKMIAPNNYTRMFDGDVRIHYWNQGLKWNCFNCKKSGGICGRSKDDRFQCFCSYGNETKTCSRGKDTDRNLKIGLGTGMGALAGIVIFLTIFMIRYQRMSSKYLRNNNSAESSCMSELSGSHVYYELPIFKNKELEEATNNFHSSQELGDGGFGTVYYGKLLDGREVAVKRLYGHNFRRVKQFMTEVQILTRLQHKNLVSLYGCTSRQSRELLLVYEYVPNGTVADHLYGDRSKQWPLPWHIRMNIAIETANALAYLHASDIIHRDVKTNNILLDENFGVKVGDFGLSRLFPNDVTHVSTAPQGTPGYVDPEYHQCYQLTEKSDVYSFGVVLVELISSMPAVDINRDRHEINLSNLAINRIQRRALQELVDPGLGFDSDARINEMITGVAELALMCLQQEKEMRPGMTDVVEELKAFASRTNAANSKRFSPPPECDEASLLRKTKFPTSPRSVTENWVSSSGSGTPTTSAKTF